MADHNAHTYFGLRVLEQLPAGVRMSYCYDHRRNLVRIYLSGPKDLILPVLAAL